MGTSTVNQTLLALALIGAATPALAADDEVLTLDALFVSRFESSREHVQDAERIRQVLSEGIAERHLVIPVEDVAPFEDYDAGTYLQACPPGKILGCSFVIGMRAEADWVISGTVDAVRELDDERTIDVTVTYIDVADSRAVLSFSTSVQPGQEDDFAQGVADGLDRIIDGQSTLVDVRGDVEDPKSAEARRRAEAQIAAEALEELEAGLGNVERVGVRSLERPKLRAEDLERYRQKDALAPWEQAGMPEREWIRYKNSGVGIVEWREQRRGRLLEVLIRGSGGYGAGPFDTLYDGRWALDSEDLSVVETVAFQEQHRGLSLYGEIELGLGITRFLEISGFVGSRRTAFWFQTHSEVAGEVEPVDEPTVAPVPTLQLGARVTFAPMPTAPARPTLTAGLLFWRGVPVSAVVDMSGLPPDLTPLGRPYVTMAQIAPGGEVVVSRNLTLFARAQIGIPLAASRYTEATTGTPTLSSRGTPRGAIGLSLEGVAGLTVHIRPFPERRRIPGDEPRQ